MPTKIDMIPTLPRNMAEDRSNLEEVPSNGVTPSDEPTVNNAEAASYNSPRAEMSGSRPINTIAYMT